MTTHNGSYSPKSHHLLRVLGVSFGLGGNWKMTDTVSLYGAINGTALDNNASIDTNVGVKMVF